MLWYPACQRGRMTPGRQGRTGYMSTKAQRDAILAALLADPALTRAALEEAYIRNDPEAYRFVESLASARSSLRERRAYAMRESRQVPSRACEHCGNGFPAYRSDSRYCSTRCRVAAYRARVTAAPPENREAVTQPAADPMRNPDYLRGLVTEDEAMAGLRVTADPTPRPDDYAVAYRCSDCDGEYSEEDADQGQGPLYECGECGTRFTRDDSADGNSNRCPDCNRFAAKVADLACPECGGGELEPAEEDDADVTLSSPEDDGAVTP